MESEIVINLRDKQINQSQSILYVSVLYSADLAD